jgi:hypothetical protein
VTQYPQMGYYRHYKGQLYLVQGIADDSNADMLLEVQPTDDPRFFRSSGGVLGTREVVVYVGLQLDGAKPGHRMKVRTVEHFMDERVPVGDNGFVRRYTYLGPVLTQEAGPQ